MDDDILVKSVKSLPLQKKTNEYKIEEILESESNQENADDKFN